MSERDLYAVAEFPANDPEHEELPFDLLAGPYFNLQEALAALARFPGKRYGIVELRVEFEYRREVKQ